MRQPLSDTQYGFRRNRSAQAVNDWLIAKDAGKTTAVVYIDLGKDFDKVCHQPLLLRLYSAGAGGIALEWLADYLRHRYQRVTAGSSANLSINRGVPQGTVISPLLFSLYVFQLPEIAAAKAATLLMFADDKILHCTKRSVFGCSDRYQRP